MQRVDRTLRALALLWGIAIACAPAHAASPQESVVVVQRDEAFEISVPVSRLVVRLPKAGFTRAMPTVSEGGTANPRYFFFEGKRRGVTLSGWFEPASRFPGVKEPVPGSYKGERLAHANVSFEKLGDWDCVFYDMRFQSVAITNLQAHLVRAGTWVELHLSGSPDLSLPEQRTLIIQTVRSLDVQETR